MASTGPGHGSGTPLAGMIGEDSVGRDPSRVYLRARTAERSDSAGNCGAAVATRRFTGK